MHQQGDEKDNLTRTGFAVLDEVQDAVRTVVDANISNSLEDIFNKHQHKNYHYFSKECHFKCDNKSPLFRNRPILTRPQMEIVYNRSTIHQQKNLSFCCSTAVPGIELTKFDLSFLNAFLNIFPDIIYWPSCLSNKSKSLQDLLNDNKHNLYHLYDKKPCCYCSPGNQLSTDDFKISRQQFENLFDKQGSVSCINIGSLGHCICLFSANNLIKESLDDWLTYMILRSCCPLKQSIEALVELRNKVRGHACNSKMSNEEFKNNWSIIEEKVPELLKHGISDQKKRDEAIQEFSKRLKDLKHRPLTEESQRNILQKLLEQNEMKQDMKELAANVQAGFEKFGKTLDELTEKIDSQCTTKTQKIKGSRQQDQIDETFPKEAINESLDQTIVTDLDVDAEPYITDNETLGQGAIGSDEESIGIGKQSDNLTGTTRSEDKQGVYKYDVLILHSQYDEGHIDEMKRIILERVDLPDVKIASTEDDIPAGANLFAAFNELMDVSRSLLLFITPYFYDDCLSRFRMHTQLVRHYEDGDCVIPVLFGESKIRKELREIGHLKPVIFFKEEDGDKCKAFIKTITTTLQHCRDYR
ncbi:uncharacterized protein LOC127715082 isoform X1 [Mytilus californianus]|uniref:uncharacterized protein LOC127715082 isoform X1 n=2 Tax=Mytilus californianus TaxID=6549 RepID=UPI00224781FE|nr:uncharacterized protein LOC127715082 isoform X1 [Mytilus californianus]